MCNHLQRSHAPICNLLVNTAKYRSFDFLYAIMQDDESWEHLNVEEETPEISNTRIPRSIASFGLQVAVNVPDQHIDASGQRVDNTHKGPVPNAEATGICKVKTLYVEKNKSTPESADELIPSAKACTVKVK